MSHHPQVQLVFVKNLEAGDKVGFANDSPSAGDEPLTVAWNEVVRVEPSLAQGDAYVSVVMRRVNLRGDTGEEFAQAANVGEVVRVFVGNLAELLP